MDKPQKGKRPNHHAHQQPPRSRIADGSQKTIIRIQAVD
jgi:hypothetical protein